MKVINLQEAYQNKIEKKKEEMDKIAERLMELYNILGYAKNEKGQTLAQRAMEDEDAEKLYDKIIQKHQKEYMEMEALELKWGQLAEEIGMWD